MANFDSIRSIRQQINLFLDHELPSEEQEVLQYQIENDPRCNRIFNKEKDFREFVRTNVKRPSITPEFINSLKNRIV